MKSFSFLALFALLALCSRAAWATGEAELRELYRGPRAQAMGNAFVAVADDEEALYYNPAGLAGIEKTRFNYFQLDTEISDDIITTAQSSLKTFNNLNSSTLNALIGKNVYGRAAFTPTYVGPHFGVGVLVDQQLAIEGQNLSLPNMTLGYQTTTGVQVGYGFSVKPNFRRSKSELRLGIGAKLLFRRGGYRTLTLAQMVNIDQDSFKQLIGDFGSGAGFDLGVQHIYRLNNHLSFMSGAAYTEIGDVKFSSTADPQPGNLSAGVATRYHLSHINMTLAYDLRHLNTSTDWRKRNHFGAELSIPVFALYAGVSENDVTYGASFDVWLAKVTLASYATELGALAGQITERRYLLSIQLGI